MTTSIKSEKSKSWALITGASSGIGKEFAYQLAASGYNLVLSSRRQDKLEQLGKSLRSEYNIEYNAIAADLSVDNAVDTLIQRLEKSPIELVVSNAGTGNPGEFVEKNMDVLLKMVNTSVVAHLKITHHFAQVFTKQRKGKIILVSAMGAKNGLPFMAHDAGTRAYIRSLGLGLHVELKRYGVKLTVLETTPTDTPIVKSLGFDEKKMPVKLLTTKQCVSETLKALDKNQSLVLPGRMFRMMMRLLPSSFMRKMNGKMLAEGNNISWVVN